MSALRGLGRRLWEGLLDLFTEGDGPAEPAFDPVHLGAVCIVCLTVIGALYWLLWTLLVYEGGLFVRPRPASAAALLLAGLAVWALHRLYRAVREGASRAAAGRDA